MHPFNHFVDALVMVAVNTKRRLQTHPNILLACLSFTDLGPVSQRSRTRKFSDPESRSKISNLLITELFCSCILKMKRCFLHTISFRRVHLSVIRYRLTKNCFTAGPKSFRAFRETGPWAGLFKARLS